MWAAHCTDMKDDDIDTTAALVKKLLVSSPHSALSFPM
jgi:hypothetical protein